jgi:hypothetical protein
VLGDQADDSVADVAPGMGQLGERAAEDQDSERPECRHTHEYHLNRVPVVPAGARKLAHKWLQISVCVSCDGIGQAVDAVAITLSYLLRDCGTHETRQSLCAQFRS